ARRVARNLSAALTLVGASLLAGMVGYRYFETIDWVDAFANAAMILSGMGPLGPLQTVGGKVFAGFYALYSGLVVIAVAGLIGAPVFHRLLHQFHVDDRPK